MSEGNNKDGVFTYTYSAKQQEEIKAIRDKYVKKEEDKMERLRRLDRSVTKKGSACALALGTISALIMGTGMSMAMAFTDTLLVPGIVVGLVGIFGVCMAYPLYAHVTKRERERVAPEILHLTQELLK